MRFVFLILLPLLSQALFWGCPYCYHYQPVYQTYAGAGLPAFMESPRTIFYRSPRYQIVSEENPVVIGEQYDALPTPQHAVVISNDQSVINDAEYDPYITMRFRNYGRQPSRATFSSGRKAISNDRSAMYRTSPNTLRLTGRPTDAAFKENRNEEQHGHSEQEEPATKEYTRGGTSESSREFIPIGKDNEQLLKPSPFSQ